MRGKSDVSVKLRAQEAAARLGVSATTFYNLIKRGEFPRGVKLGARLVVWGEDVVDAWVAEKTKRQRDQLSDILADRK